ncbi:MAG: DEAD/DEAH box helicase [Gammaproteobacteria bacterium]
MNHWLLESIHDNLNVALSQASQIHIYREILNDSPDIDFNLIKRNGEALELIVLDILLENNLTNNEKELVTLRSISADAFRLYRVLPVQKTPSIDAELRLRQSSLAVLGDMGADAARWLRETSWPELPLDSNNWQERTWATILDIWLRLIRKQGWTDRDIVLERITSLRDAQQKFENEYLQSIPLSQAKSEAVELIALYHLAKAAEILALYITDGVVEGNYQIRQLLDSHFDRVFAICENSKLIVIEPLSRLLAATATQMVANSIWTVTRAVNSRVTRFVQNLVDQGRGDKALFDVLPPQRRALAEKGLLGSSRRAVVVSLPTSSGKTLIAQFRILQALNQFDEERGWVAYLAPTRTLVNQIARKLRREFAPLDIIVEQVSPALEVDGIEAGLLQEKGQSREFRVLVTTPEKLDLMLRQGWEETIGRPLTLVVVDEAHNIQNTQRGLKLELLLATINMECQRAQFLLLTPFINNAREVSRWLGDENSEDISLSLDWQPNDRVISIVKPVKGEQISNFSFDYDLIMETVYTNRNTLAVDKNFQLPKSTDLNTTFAQISKKTTLLAAATAYELNKRGPVIVMHQRPDWVWVLATSIKSHVTQKETTSNNIRLVQQFLELEFGSDFLLIELLSFGIGVHHAGLSDEARNLMEWLFEEEELDYLVATTTIAQGVNFPVSGVVMASHQYPFSIDMPPEDFWNIAGRAGRVDQGSLGVVALVATDESKVKKLKTFINKQTSDLNSALITMVDEANDLLEDLGAIVYHHPEWSSFLQYLAHTYRQMGKPQDFSDQIEQVLRGTLGFETLRHSNPESASKLLTGIHTYTEYLQEPGQPLKLVDSTGFSLQSIKTVLFAAGQKGINKDSWNSGTLFSTSGNELQTMMGILLRVPELRENLEAVTGGDGSNGDKLALIIKDWVNGESVSEIARKYFKTNDNTNMTEAITKCGKNLFGKLTQTASWGIGALLSITGSELSEVEFNALRNLPSQIYYGVNDDNAIALGLLGVPRSAAVPLANTIGNTANQSLIDVRNKLKSMDPMIWTQALGESNGIIYYKIWRIFEGLDS